MKLNLEWVTEAVGEEYKKWSTGDIIKINAQTGTGKTYFIKKVLIPYIREYERLLYVCNRTNLKRQLKKDLLEQFGEEIPYIRDEKTKEYILDESKNKILDIDKLDQITTIGNITITSYQAIHDNELNKEYELDSFNGEYDYIVMDECHMIFTDGSFNNKCRLAFDKLIKNNNRFATKIFITATIDEVDYCINKSIERYIGNKPKIWNYTTGIDYSYVNIKYFKQMKDIIQTIKNDKTSQKWLVFVTNKDEGKNIVKELGEDKASFIQAGTKNNKELNNIINNSKFEKKVLVATKVLDNGVNIDDIKLTNIVIMAWDKITFIQMLGRKRINIEDTQNINLYIPVRYKKSFTTKLRNYNKQRDEIELFNNDINRFKRKYNNDFTKISKYEHLFYLDSDDKNTWKINKVGDARLLIDMKFASDMIKNFKTLGEFAFVMEQLNWINRLSDFGEENLIEDVIADNEVDELEKYLEGVTGIRLFKEEQQKLSDLLIKELTTIGNDVDYRTQKLKPKTAEVIIREQLKLPYAVVQKPVKYEGKTKRCWIISKLD